MRYTFNIITKLELATWKRKAKVIAREYVTYLFMCILLAILLYVLYIAISFRYATYTQFTYTEVLERTLLFTIVLSSLLTMLFIYLSRGKLKQKAYQSFFFNTNVAAIHIVTSSYFLLYCLHVLFVIGALLPTIMVNVVLFDTTEMVIKVLLYMVLATAMIYSALLFLWIWSYNLSYKILRHFRLQLPLFVILIGVCSITGYKIVQMLNVTFILIPAWIVGLLMIIGLYVLKYLFQKNCTQYVLGQFSDYGEKVQKSKTCPVQFHPTNDFLRWLMFEWIRIKRSKILSEQIFLFMALIIMTMIFYKIFSIEEFSFFYNLIVNYGLVEIMIILPIVMGSFYIIYESAIYNLKVKRTYYLAAHLIIYFFVNVVLYYSFLFIVHLIIDYPIIVSWGLLTKIIFVTTISMLISFVIPITQQNKVFLLISTVIFIGILEFIVMAFISSQIILYTFYSCVSILCIAFVFFNYLRRPVVE